MYDMELLVEIVAQPEELAKNIKINLKAWSGQQDLNLRPSAPKADALPDCAMPRRDRYARARYTLHPRPASKPQRGLKIE